MMGRWGALIRIAGSIALVLVTAADILVPGSAAPGVVYKTFYSQRKFQACRTVFPDQ